MPRPPAALPARPLPPAAERLKTRKEQIIEAWRARVRESVPAARGRSAPQLRDDLPGFLDRLAEALSPRQVRPPSLGGVREISCVHGQQRARLAGYSLRDLLLEYGVLREVVIGALEEEGPISRSERDTILSAVERGMAEAAERFVAGTQHDLRASEERYRLVVEGVKDHAIMKIGTDGRIADWNQGAENVFRYGREEILGRESRILFVPEDVERGAVEQEMRSAAEAGKAEDERWHVRKDGSRFFAAGIMNPLRDPSGRLTGYVKVLRDQTEQRRMNDELKKQKQLFQTIFDAAPDLIILADAERRIVASNPAAERILGYAPGELLGKSTRVFYAEADDFEAQGRTRYNPDSGVRGAQRYQSRYRKRNGETFISEVTAEVLRNPNGAVVGYLAIIRDVTAQVQARREVSRALNAIPVAVSRMDAEGRFVFVNESSARYFGPPERVLGKTLRGLFGERHYDEAFGRGVDAALRGEAVRFEWHSPPLEDGRRHHFVVHYIPELGADGSVRGFLSSAFNVDEMKRVEGDLKAALAETGLQRSRLEEEREIRERFVATLSHDLRSPLSAARMGAELVARRSGGAEPLRQLSSRIIKSIDRVDRMIRDLLDANRIRAGERLPLEITECDLSAVARETLDELTTIHGERFELKAPEPVRGHWNPDAIRRILENLCINAVKYGSTDSPVVVRVTRAASDRALLSVHNRGQPIPPEDQTTLFEPYRRAHSVQQGQQRGWGLGLTLVKGLADAHGGSVSVESDATDGTLFTVILPLDARMC